MFRTEVANNGSIMGLYSKNPDHELRLPANQTQIIRTLNQVTIDVDDIPVNDNFFAHPPPKQNFTAQLRPPVHTGDSASPDDIAIEVEQDNISGRDSVSPQIIITLPEIGVDEVPVTANPPSPTPSEVSNTHCCLLNMPLDEEKANSIESYSSWALRHTQNLTLTVLRNLVSVGGPTALREFSRRKVFPELLAVAPKYVAPTLGGLALAAPIVLQLVGLIRDCRRGTQTKETLLARMALITMNLAAGGALVATGGVPAAASALMAALFSYVAPRDAIQYFFKLSDNNTSRIQCTPTAIAAVGYSGNQVAVDWLMDLISDTLKPIMGELPAHIAGRALVNIAGETGDEMLNRGVNAVASNNPALAFRLGLRPKTEMTPEKIADTIYNTFASRASLFSTSFAASFASGAEGLLGNMLVGITLGLGYVPFIYTHAQKTPPASNPEDIELVELPA